MRSSWLILLVAALAFLCLSSQFTLARAEEDDEDVTIEEEADAGNAGSAGSEGVVEDEDEDVATDEDEEYILRSSPDLSAIVYFPEFADKKFPVQTEVTALVGFHNTGEKAFNITGIAGSLHSPFDLGYYIQNFTAKFLGVVVEPGQQVTVDYQIKPRQDLEPLQFWFSAYVIYNDSDDAIFKTTVYNNTIELVDKPSEFNVRRTFGYVAVIAIAGLAAFTVYGPKTSSSKGVERGTNESAGGWGENVYKQAKSAKKIVRDRSKSPVGQQ
jgi:hypothetical protein